MVYRVWDRFKGMAWRELVQAGLVPVTAGLVLATGYVVTRAADGTSVVAHLVTVAVALLATLTRVHPLAWIACGAALGMAGAI